MLRAICCVFIGALAACGGGPTCNNTCPAAGATQCSGASIQTCIADAHSCLSWGPATTCGSGKTCAGNTCVDVCTTSAVQTACAQAAAHVDSCCSGFAVSGTQLCQSSVGAGHDPATDCGTLNGTSCGDLHTSFLAQGKCCCVAGQSCDPNASNACVPRCSTGADCASASGRPACAPTIGTVNGAQAVAGPYICVQDDGTPGHGCIAVNCTGGASNVCAKDSRNNRFCTTPCTGDAACANTGVACCNVQRTLDSSPACGLCGAP